MPYLAWLEYQPLVNIYNKSIVHIVNKFTSLVSSLGNVVLDSFMYVFH